MPCDLSWRSSTPAEPIRSRDPSIRALSQSPAHLSGVKPTRQHFRSVDQHDRNSITELFPQAGGVDIDDLDRPTLAFCTSGHDRQSLGTDSAHLTGQEANRLHRSCLSRRTGTTTGSGIVDRLMRPATVLAIGLLLLTLAIAGVVFVIQLLSVT